METRTNIWIRLTLAILTAPLLQWGMAKFTGMFAGLAMNESGAPIPVGSNMLLASISSAIAFLMATVIFTIYVDQRKLAAVGFQLSNIKVDGLKGVLVATFILCFSTLILSTTALIEFTTVNFNPGAIIPLFFSMGLVALGEEFFFRGYIQRNAMEQLSKFSALLFTAIIFTLMHIGNPSQHLLSLPGVFAGGLLLGLNYAFTKNIWFGVLLHFTWNFLQGPILGFPVSGFKLDSVLIQTQQGASLLTGGSFGLEASLITIILNLSITWFIWKQLLQQQKSNQAYLNQ